MRGMLRSGNTDPGGIVTGSSVTIDLRRRPSRADLGLVPGRNDRSYQQEPGGPELDTTVILPSGVLRLPAFVITVSGDDHTPAGFATDREPRSVLVERLFPRADAAIASLTGDGDVLGLGRPDLAEVAARLTDRSGPLGPRQVTRYGLVADWLSVAVEVIGREDGRVQVNYQFGLRLAGLVPNGVYHLDLTGAPGRDELGFRPGYSIAAIEPPAGEELLVRVVLPTGVLQRPVHSVRSSTTAPGAPDPTGTGRPVRTDFALHPSDIATAQRILLADADPLDLDPAEIAAAFTGEPGTHRVNTLSGLRTADYELTVTADVNYGRTDEFAAGLTYTIRYPAG